MKPIFELDGKEYNNEQDIIEADLGVIYHYCCEVKGRWPAIEHLIIDDAWTGYWYARDVIQGRFDPELEELYLMKTGKGGIIGYKRNLHKGWYRKRFMGDTV